MMTESQYFRKIEKEELMTEKIEEIADDMIAELECELKELELFKGDKVAFLKNAKEVLDYLSEDIKDALIEIKNVEEENAF